MKLSMWSSYYVADDPETMVKKLTEAGFHYTELSNEHSQQIMERGKQYYRDFRKFMDDCNFIIPQGHLNFCKVINCDSEQFADLAAVDEKFHRACLDGWKKELELYEALGIERAVLHPGGTEAFTAGLHPREKLDEMRLKGLNELLDFTAGMNVMICIENMAAGEYLSTSWSLLELLKNTGRKNIGICLDTGHLNLGKLESQEDFIHACGKKLQALHIADNNGGWDEHLLPYRGNIDWEKTITALKDIGYDRLINFEVPGCSLRFCRKDEELKELYLPFIRRLGEKLFAELP